MSDYGTVNQARKSGTVLSVNDLKAALLAEAPGLAAAEALKAQTDAAYAAALAADKAAHKDLVERRRHVSKLTRWLGQAEGKVQPDSVFDPYQKPEELPGEVGDEDELDEELDD